MLMTQDVHYSSVTLSGSARVFVVQDQREWWWNRHVALLLFFCLCFFFLSLNVLNRQAPGGRLQTELKRFVNDNKPDESRNEEQTEAKMKEDVTEGGSDVPLSHTQGRLSDKRLHYDKEVSCYAPDRGSSSAIARPANKHNKRDFVFFILLNLMFSRRSVPKKIRPQTGFSFVKIRESYCEDM